MKTYEIITVAAIILGPILAVWLQIWSTNRNQIIDQQIQTFRALAGTRHMPADPGYSTAINMTPIDFNKVPSVMAAHSAYIACILFKPNPGDEAVHEQQMFSRQTKLIFEMSKHLRLNLPETEIQTTAYAASGFVQRDNLMLDAWGSWKRIADALEAQNRALISPPESPNGSQA